MSPCPRAHPQPAHRPSTRTLTSLGASYTRATLILGSSCTTAEHHAPPPILSLRVGHQTAPIQERSLPRIPPRSLRLILHVPLSNPSLPSKSQTKFPGHLSITSHLTRPRHVARSTCSYHTACMSLVETLARRLLHASHRRPPFGQSRSYYSTLQSAHVTLMPSGLWGNITHHGKSQTARLRNRPTPVVTLDIHLSKSRKSKQRIDN